MENSTTYSANWVRNRSNFTVYQIARRICLCNWSFEKYILHSAISPLIFLLDVWRLHLCVLHPMTSGSIQIKHHLTSFKSSRIKPNFSESVCVVNYEWKLHLKFNKWADVGHRCVVVLTESTLVEKGSCQWSCKLNTRPSCGQAELPFLGNDFEI